MASMLNAFKAAIEPGVGSITGKITSLNRLLDQIEPLIDTLRASNPSQAQLSEVQAYVLAKIKEIDDQHVGVHDRVSKILNKLNPGANSGASNATLNAMYANVEAQRELNRSYPAPESIPSLASLVRNSSQTSTGNAASVTASTLSLPKTASASNQELIGEAENARAAAEAELARYQGVTANLARVQHPAPSEVIPPLFTAETDLQVQTVEQLTATSGPTAANAAVETLSPTALQEGATQAEQIPGIVASTPDATITGLSAKANVNSGIQITGVKVAPFYKGFTRFLSLFKNNWGSTATLTSPSDAKYVKVQYKYQDTGDEKTVYFYTDEAVRSIIEDLAKEGSTSVNALGRPSIPETTSIEHITGYSLINDNNVKSENKYKILLHTTWGSFGLRAPLSKQAGKYKEMSKLLQDTLIAKLELAKLGKPSEGRTIDQLGGGKKTRRQIRKTKKGKKRFTRK